MFISWKTDGSEGSLALMQGRMQTPVEADTTYGTWADANGRTAFKWEVKGEELFITEEWSIDRAAYDAFVAGGQIDHSPDGVNLPMVETTDHLVWE